MGLEYYFPTPLYTAQLEGAVLARVQAELEPLLERHRDRLQPAGQGQHQVTDPNFGSNIIKQEPLTLFQHELDYHVNQYLLALGTHKQIAQWRVSNSWITHTGHGQYARPHNHGCVDIAGVYYIETQGTEGNLYINSPVKSLEHSYPYHLQPTQVDFEPKVGRMIMFPGWLEHGTRHNLTNLDRVSLSWNIRCEAWDHGAVFNA